LASPSLLCRSRDLLAGKREHQSDLRLEQGTDLPTSLIWAAVSVGVSIVFASSWPAFIRSVDAKHWSRAIMVLVALLITGAYSVSAALGSAMGGRASALIEAKDVEGRKAKAQATWDAAKAELDALTTTKPATDLQTLIDNAKADLAKLPASRPIAEIEALIRGAAMNPRGSHGCTAVNGSLRMSCPKLEAEKARAAQRDRLTGNIAAWTAEIGQADQRRAEQRDKAKAAMDKAADELATTGPAKVANSDAVALASYLQGLGLNIDADRANKLLVLLAVLVIECGGGLALAVGMALSEGVRSGQMERPIVQSEHSLSERSTEDPNAGSDRPRGNNTTIDELARSLALNERPVRSSHNRVLDALRAKGGVLFGSQGALGAAFGWSKTRLHEVLHELQAAGRVRLSVSRQGTAVRLVAGAA
jgi:hypothetical protein